LVLALSFFPSFLSFSHSACLFLCPPSSVFFFVVQGIDFIASFGFFAFWWVILFFSCSFCFQKPDPKDLQISLTGFLGKNNAAIFMKELWAMLNSASTSDSGIPAALLNKKKEELAQRKVGLDLFLFFFCWGCFCISISCH
jgi:hypothetical protein